MIGIMFLVVVGTALWACVDARTLGVKHGCLNKGARGFFDMGPGEWFVAILLFWLIAFPVYLAQRKVYVARAAR